MLCQQGAPGGIAGKVRDANLRLSVCLGGHVKRHCAPVYRRKVSDLDVANRHHFLGELLKLQATLRRSFKLNHHAWTNIEPVN